MNQIKARMALSVVITAGTGDDLTTAVNTWLAAADEKTLLDAQFQVDGGTFAVILYYTEG